MTLKETLERQRDEVGSYKPIQDTMRGIQKEIIKAVINEIVWMDNEIVLKEDIVKKLEEAL